MEESDDEGDDIYECSVCLTNMVDRNPRILSCHHSFCEECLKQLLGQTEPNIINCPTCRNTTETESVEDLPKNFNLQKFKDYAVNLRRNILKKVCRKCRRNAPDSRCMDCDSSLCQQCRGLHDKQHRILKFCEQHNIEIHSICLKCMSVACLLCQELHQDHNEDLFEIVQGIQTLKGNILSKSEELIKGLLPASEILENEKKTLTICKNLRRVFETEIEKIEKLLKSTESQLDKFDEEFTAQAQNHVDEITHVQRQAREILVSFPDAQKANDGEFIDKYLDLLKETDDCLTKLQVSSSKICPVPTVSIAVISEVPEKVIEVKEAKKMPNFKKENMSLCPLINLSSLKNSSSIQCPDQVCAINEQHFAFSDWKLPYIGIVNKKGTLVSRFYGSQQDHAITGMCTYNQSLYFVQSNAVNKVDFNGGFPGIVEVFEPHIDKMSKIAILDPNCFIITSSRLGTIHKYYPKENKQILVLQDLKEPSSIAVYKNNAELKYIVTEKQIHAIKVYDQDWNRITSFGGRGEVDGQFQYPSSACVLPNSNLLVTDWGNNRLSEFTMEGRFGRHWLTDSDGIKNPMSSGFDSSVLYITETSKHHHAIKSFKIQVQ